jgi:hypothetical protein
VIQNFHTFGIISVNFSPLELSQWDFHKIDIFTLRIIFVDFSPSKSSQWDFTRLLFHLWNRLGQPIFFFTLRNWLRGRTSSLGNRLGDFRGICSEVLSVQHYWGQLRFGGSSFGILRSTVCTCHFGFLWAKEAELRNSSRQGFLIANWRT